jgi:hypothetical protein
LSVEVMIATWPAGANSRSQYFSGWLTSVSADVAMCVSPWLRRSQMLS